MTAKTVSLLLAREVGRGGRRLVIATEIGPAMEVEFVQGAENFVKGLGLDTEQGAEVIEELGLEPDDVVIYAVVKSRKHRGLTAQLAESPTAAKNEASWKLEMREVFKAILSAVRRQRSLQ